MAWISRHLKSACCWSRGADDVDSKTARTWRAGSSSRREAVGFSASLVGWRPSAASEQTSNLLIRFDPRCDSFNAERRFFCGTLPSVIYLHQHNLINLNPLISLEIVSGDWQSSLNGLALCGASNVLEMSQHRFHCPNNHNKTPLEGVASLHGDETQTDTLVFFMQIVADAVNKIFRDSGSRKKLLFCWPNATQSNWHYYSKTVDPNRKQTPTSVDVQINSFQLRLNIKHRWCFRNEKSFCEKHLQVKSIYHFIGFYRFDRKVSWFYVKTSEQDVFVTLIRIVADYASLWQHFR